MTNAEHDKSVADAIGGVVLLGPTAGGKSDLAAALAAHAGGEVIGADSMQVYRHLDAGTAKPPRKLRDRVPHQMIDIVEPTERFTVHDWLDRATAEITRVTSSGGLPVVVGGTNLYLKALLEGMFDGPGQDPAFRASLAEIATPALHEKLRAIDPATAQRVMPADRQRIVRALEVHHLTGNPISALQTQWGDGGSAIADGGCGEGLNPSAIRHPPSAIRTFRLLGLRWSAEAINPRINLRVKAMFYPEKVDAQLAADVCINGESLIEETKRLKEEGKFDPHESTPHADAERGPTPTLSESASEASGTSPNQAREALGYKQLLALIEGTDPKIKTIDDAFERTKILTRRFAKQQRTWLKRFAGVHWIDCDDADTRRITEAAITWLMRST